MMKIKNFHDARNPSSYSMKKIITLLMLIIACPIAYASIDSSYECDKKSCVEGSMVHWTVPVKNNINRTIVVEYIKLVDENSLPVAFYDAERNKTIQPGETYTYEFEQLIVAPASGYTWYYKPCMRVRLEGGNASQFVCKDAVKTFTMIPKSKAECMSDSGCAVNERCDEGTLKCKQLNCTAGEAVKEHSCIAANNNGHVKLIAGIVVVVIVVICLIVLIAATAIKAKKPKKSKKNKKKEKKQEE